MSDQFVAEIRMFPGTFAPKGWALCNGQVLPIAQNTALFSLLGVRYGGDGSSTFALPDLRGRIPMHPGAGAGLTPRTLAETGGSETVTLAPAQIPNHTHNFNRPASGSAATQTNPQGNLPAITPEDQYSSAGTNVNMGPDAMSPAGGSLPHNNLQPYLVVNFIIALEGIFPSRWP
jgi:microcystin-dependent protein